MPSGKNIYKFQVEITILSAIISAMHNDWRKHHADRTEQKGIPLLLDLVYIGNWVLNSTRGNDRFQIYDDLESKLFGLCPEHGMGVLTEKWEGTDVPSRAYADGGIHEAIAFYEDNIFYEILAEELSRRDMNYAEITDENYDEIVGRMNRYMDEFQLTGVDRLVLED
jgi:hypothetical protein